MKAEKQLPPEIRELRTERLNEYRSRGYSYLADAIRSAEGSGAALELLDVTSDEGGEFQIDVQAFWDDKPDRDIRVIAEALPIPLKPLFGFIPIYLGGPCDDFIMRPDGTFVDED
jgi:hypothetical protein